MAGRSGRPPCLKAGLLIWLAAAVVTLPVAACSARPGAWQVARVSQGSDWKEFDALGRRLVHESGWLPGLVLTGEWHCDHWQWQAQLTQEEGWRLYDGQTSAGTVQTSRSALRQFQGHLQARTNVGAGWQLGGRLSHHRSWREIASAAGAAGYPERFGWTLLSLGAQWQATLGPGQLSLAAWAGKDLVSGMVVDLPGRDQATLGLGSIRQLELAASWRVPLSPAWHVEAALGYRRTEIGQGAVAPIQRHGVPVAVAHQPRISLMEMPATIRLGYQF